MFSLRRGVVSAARVAAVARATPRAMSSAVGAKERAEEAVYFQREDERLKSELKAKLERVLALEDSHEEKKDLIGLLSTN